MKIDKYFTQKICAFEFFNAFILLYPVYALFFQISGVSTTQISLLFILWSISTLITNTLYLPLSRFITQKTLVITGCVCKALCFVLWICFPNFYVFLFGFFLWGIFYSFLSRAYEGLLYNYLKQSKQEKLYLKLRSKKQAFHCLGYLLSGLGSLLVVYGYNLLFFFSVLSCACSILIFSSLHFPKSVNCFYEKPTPIKEIASKIFKVFHLYPVAFYHVILLTVVLGLVYLDEYFGLVGVEIGVPEQYVGFIYIAALLTQTISSYFAYLFEKISNISIYGLIILCGILFLGISYFYVVFALIFLVLFFALFSIFNILLFSRIQMELKTQAHRSVFLGFYSFLEQISTITSYLAMMLSASLGSLRYGFAILGTGVIVLGVLYIVATLVHRMRPTLVH